jgi:hypothetical protein
MRLAAAVLIAASAARAATEVELYYSALQRMISAQLFTQDGRRYVRGSKDTRCSYAYLENPVVGEAGGRLRIESRFSGRSALNVLGKCVGLGDSFDLIILATPIYRNGAMAFKDVYVETRGKENLYTRSVRTTLARTLGRDLRWPIEGLARQILETHASTLPMEKKMGRFDVTGIRVQKESLVLLVDFLLQVR